MRASSGGRDTPTGLSFSFSGSVGDDLFRLRVDVAGCDVGEMFFELLLAKRFSVDIRRESKSGDWA